MLKKIFAEEFLTDNSEKGMPDYKFYCFEGIVKFIQVKSSKQHYYFYEEKNVWNYQVFYDVN